MKTLKGLFLKAITVSLLLVIATFVYANRTASARAPRPTAVELIGAGAVTIAPDQGMRVNLVNVVETSTVRLSVKFIDKSGQVLKAEQLSLEPGSTSAAAVFGPADSPAGALIPAVQGPIHVIVESVPDTPEAPYPFVIPSLEIFERKAGKVVSVQTSFLRLNSTAITGGQ